jgi:hypothetical protein
MTRTSVGQPLLSNQYAIDVRPSDGFDNIIDLSPQVRQLGESGPTEDLEDVCFLTMHVCCRNHSVLLRPCTQKVSIREDFV